jgi:hypothetical protein
MNEILATIGGMLVFGSVVGYSIWRFITREEPYE